MAAVQRKLEKLVTAAVPVLIQGESGTGKEIICRFIHLRSPWNDGPFVKVNCPAIPGTLLESELFGYEKGAFTGAYGSKLGRVEQAHGGTLFLDEIAELEPALQAKLLQLLQDGQFSRIGAQIETAVKVRVICATNRDLEEEIGLGNFRQDLFYRINVVNVQLPPLRERLMDLPILTNYFLEVYSSKFNTRPRPLSARLMAMLQSYRWSGNVRELENLMKRYVILGSEDAITSELINREQDPLDPEIATDGSVSLKAVTRRAVRDLERKIILKVLQANNWNRKQSAQKLKISYRALLYKLKDAGVTSTRIHVNGSNGAVPEAED
jgi:two-component system response regulator AtoC